MMILIKTSVDFMVGQLIAKAGYWLRDAQKQFKTMACTQKINEVKN